MDMTTLHRTVSRFKRLGYRERDPIPLRCFLAQLPSACLPQPVVLGAAIVLGRLPGYPFLASTLFMSTR
jgi:hypothetical protein